MRTLFLVDVPNLFAGVRNKWPNHNLDYEAVITAYEGIGCKVQTKVAYLAPDKSRLNSFYSVLKRIGFLFDDFDPVLVGLKIAEAVGFFDAVVIGSSDPNIVQALVYARQKGMHTYVFGVGVSPLLSLHAEAFELDDSYIRNRLKAAEPLDVPTDGVGSTVVNPTG